MALQNALRAQLLGESAALFEKAAGAGLDLENSSWVGLRVQPVRFVEIQGRAENGIEQVGKALYFCAPLARGVDPAGARCAGWIEGLTKWLATSRGEEQKTVGGGALCQILSRSRQGDPWIPRSLAAALVRMGGDPAREWTLSLAQAGWAWPAVALEPQAPGLLWDAQLNEAANAVGFLLRCAQAVESKP